MRKKFRLKHSSDGRIMIQFRKWFGIWITLFEFTKKNHLHVMFMMNLLENRIETSNDRLTVAKKGFISVLNMGNGEYVITNSRPNQVVVTFKDSDDEYARNCAMEAFEYITKEI